METNKKSVHFMLFKWVEIKAPTFLISTTQQFTQARCLYVTYTTEYALITIIIDDALVPLSICMHAIRYLIVTKLRMIV